MIKGYDMACDTKVIIENLSTAILVTDNSSRIIFANTAAEQLCGMSRTHLSTLKFTDLIDKSERSLLATIEDPDFQNNFQGFSAASVMLSPEAGTTILVNINIEHYLADSSCGLIIELHTQPHQQKLIAEVDRQNHHLAARDLIRSLAHEIKNPLGGIRGAAQLLEMTHGAISDIKDYTSVIIEQTDRLKMLVDNLLGPQKVNPLIMANIHFVIEKVLSLVNIQQKLSGGVKIKKDYDPSLPEIPLDIDGLQQVLLNIVNNAIQAMKEANTANPVVLIKTRASHRAIVKHQSYPTSIVISISNNGPEIPEKIKDTLFFPMVTTKTSGNGLGLSIAQSIVERHGGTIECLSNKEKTTFKIILPLRKN